jgi:drug/metabolite transporter (DMT)-like permease
VTVLADSVGQIVWKQAASALPDSNDPSVLLLGALTQPIAWALLALLLAQLWLWLRVLRHADLSYAQPVTSLSYVGVALLSWLWLGEAWGWRAAASVLLILAGVVLISSGPASRCAARAERGQRR